ncbi:AAEL017480-PA [Gryllus bimaculatus]|nr:AAEL017480-PA [Gryllus bimaculatus]
MEGTSAASMDPRCPPQNPVASNSSTGQSTFVPVTSPSSQSRGKRQQRGEMTPSSSQQSLRSFITTTSTPTPANLSPGSSHHGPGFRSFIELAINGDDAGLLELLSSGEDAVLSREQLVERGVSALHVAASRGHIKAVIVLVGVIHVDATDDQLRTPLHLAALNGHRLVAVRLVDFGAKINAKDAAGFTPMALAARNEHTLLVYTLLRKKAKIDEKAMVMAANNCSWDLIGTFLLRTRGLEDTCDKRGDPLIVIAARNRRWDTVKLLLKKGASPTKCSNRIEPQEETALMYATKYRAGEIVDLLMRKETKYNTEQLQYAFGKNCGGRILKGEDPLFGPSEVTPTRAMGVIDPCTQAASQTENGSIAAEHAATTSAAVAYSSLVKDTCTSGQVQEAILRDESAPSVCDPLPEMASEACILDEFDQWR